MKAVEKTDKVAVPSALPGPIQQTHSTQKKTQVDPIESNLMLEQ